MLASLADWCYRRRRVVVLLWIAGFAASIALAGAFGGEFRQDYTQPGSDSQAALTTLKKNFPQKSGDILQIVLHAEAGMTDPGVRPRAERILADVAGSDHVVGVISPFSPQGERQISPDGRTAYAEVDLDRNDNQFTPAQATRLVQPILKAGGGGLQVEVGGAVATLAQTPEFGSESLALVAAAIILLLTFGSVVAAGLPLITALFGIGIAGALGGLLCRLLPVPDWAPAVASMIGIGIGIDYALLIVTRFRTCLADGQEPRQAVTTTITTAGRSVIFAGLVVVVSMLGMLLMDQPFVVGFALSTVLAALVIMAASVTLLPAVLGFAGRNIERLRIPFAGRNARPFRGSFWYRWSRSVQRRPWVAAAGGLVILLGLSAPALGIRLGFPDPHNDPPQRTTRQAYDLLAEGFGPGFSDPLLLTVQGRSGPQLLTAANQVGERLRAVHGVAFVSAAVANPAADTALLQLIPSTSAQDKATERLVDRLREQELPAATSRTGLTVHVGGALPASLDMTRAVSDRLPFFVGGVVLLSFLLLMTVFRSILVPLKAAVVNLLSIGSALGVLALATDGGPLGSLIGLPEPIPVPTPLVMMMFAILFGLSMDYEIFLMSRIREEYDRSGDAGLAVADGLARTARVITAAAAVMVTVFLAFVPNEDVVLKMLGVGLASAILLDATVVRMILVPATMQLLGARAWWLPGWLGRALPNLTVEARGVAGPDSPAVTLVGPRSAPELPSRTRV